MPRTSLTQAKKWSRRFNDWARGRCREEKGGTEKLAIYLGVTKDTINKRLQGNVTWSLPDALATIEYFEETPDKVLM